MRSPRSRPGVWAGGEILELFGMARREHHRMAQLGARHEAVAVRKSHQIGKVQQPKAAAGLYCICSDMYRSVYFVVGQWLLATYEWFLIAATLHFQVGLVMFVREL